MIGMSVKDTFLGFLSWAVGAPLSEGGQAAGIIFRVNLNTGMTVVPTMMMAWQGCEL